MTTPPCSGSRDVYDVLTDHTRPDPEYVTAARNMCATCVLRDPATADGCLRGAIANGDRWASHVLGRRLTAPAPEPVTKRGKAAAGAHERNRAARLEELTAIVARGGDVEEACRSLGVSRDGLWKWCDKWGHGDVWRALNPRPATSNQHQRRDGVGEISTRRTPRKRVAA